MRISFQLDLRVTFLAVAVLPVLLSLGVWQLNRADEKREIIEQRQIKQSQPDVALSSLLNTPKDRLAFTPVELRGQFDSERLFFLDNAIYESSVGYEILQPFEYLDLSSNSKHWALVNRGWVKAPGSRDQLPEVYPAPSGPITIRGEIYSIPGESYVLEPQEFTRDQWPQVIQTVDIEQISAAMGIEFFPKQIRLNADEPSALLAYWEPVAVTPEKHVGYAVQWFSMSIGLILWFLFASTNVWNVIRNKFSN
ncbi:SURF1 family protein [Aurantivibrio plasticivorans]